MHYKMGFSKVNYKFKHLSIQCRPLSAFDFIIINKACLLVSMQNMGHGNTKNKYITTDGF